MLDERAHTLQEALTAAIREHIGADPVDRAQLVALQSSFRKVLEAAAAPDNTVSDIAYRAELAAAFDVVYRRIYAASKVS